MSLYSLTMEKISSEYQLREKAKQIRNRLVKVAVQNGAGHIAPSLSCIEILTALYYKVLNLSQNPRWGDRDRFIFSKAHGCYGVYVILADIGYISPADWENFYKGSFLSGCIERSLENGIEAGCGALGHGLPMAVGVAFGAKLQEKKYRVYCLVGDGEMQEGSNWEAIQFAVKHKLSNLTLIIDHNTLQAMDFLKKILTPEEAHHDLQKKLHAFGFEVKTCNGHRMKNIITVMENWIDRLNMMDKPQALIAKTVKGYGLLCMENIPKFHFRLPTDEELQIGNRFE